MIRIPIMYRKETEIISINNIVDNKENHKKYTHGTRKWKDDDSITFLQVKEKGDKTYYIYKYPLSEHDSLVHDINIKVSNNNKVITEEIHKIVILYNNKKIYSTKLIEKDGPTYISSINDKNPLFFRTNDCVYILIIFECNPEIFKNILKLDVSYKCTSLSYRLKYQPEYNFRIDDSLTETLIAEEKLSSELTCEKYRSFLVFAMLPEYEHNSFTVHLEDCFYFYVYNMKNRIRDERISDKIIDIELIAMNFDGTNINFSGKIDISYQDHRERYRVNIFKKL